MVGSGDLKKGNNMGMAHNLCEHGSSMIMKFMMMMMIMLAMMSVFSNHE